MLAMSVLFVGDSHMEALGPRLVRSFPGSHYIAHRGKGVAAYLDAGWLEQAVAQYRPSLVVIELGGNDGFNRDVSRYRSQAATLAAQAQRAGARVLWVGPPYSKQGDVQSRHAWASTVARSLPFPFFDSMRVTTAYHRDDGVHFSPHGYDVWAAEVVPFVRANEQPAGRGALYAAGGAVATLVLYWLLKAPPTPPVPTQRTVS